MNKKKIKNLVSMLREVDLYRNSPEQVREVLNFIALEFEDMIDEKIIYQVMIEKMDEEFYIVEEFDNLEEAEKFAENYGREHYKAIWIEKTNEAGDFIGKIDVED